MTRKTGADKTSENWLDLLEETKKEYQQYADDAEFRELLRRIKKKEEPPQGRNLTPSPENPLTTNRFRRT